MNILIKEWIEQEQLKHKLCACGCGEEIIIKEHHFKRGIPNFINHHSNKSEDIKNKISNSLKGKNVGEKNGMFGKGSNKTSFKQGDEPWNKGKTNVYTEETLEKISKSGIGRTPWNKDKTGLQTHTDEWKRLNSERMKGDKHPNWKGGISFIPYCKKFNGCLKNQIRERDNNICQLCGKTEKQNNQKLTIHHIHYDKENCEPDLITLCRSCNSKVNFNREYYENYFMEILNDRFNK